MSTGGSSRLHVKTPSMENMDDELIVPKTRKRTVRNVKPKVILSSDSDDTIIIEDDDEEVENQPPKPVKKKVNHRRKRERVS